MNCSVLMYRRAALLVVLGLGILGCVMQSSNDTTQVLIHSGALTGSRHNEVVSFKGIPYAAPPVGALRWRPPQAVHSWSGVRSAIDFGSNCQQNFNPQDNGVAHLPQSEDCLTLNVFAPDRASELPVMVWIHGGGFVNGSGTAALYDGTALAQQGVVVVTLNYRLGRFGFFAHPALTAAANEESLGNYGLMDMIKALQWVQTNIRQFGGDPKQVTIFGESAGGVAVNDLMVSPAAKGLFVRAIVQSGLGREPALSLSEAEQAGETFAVGLGLNNASVAELRNLSAEQILAGGDPDIRVGGGSIADGRVLPMAPMDAFAKGLQAKVPYIIGWNSLEFPVPAEQVSAMLAAQADSSSFAQLASAYPDGESYLMHIISDKFFVEPALKLAAHHAAAGNPTWAYQFSVVSSSMRDKLNGAPHASERQYVFQTLNASPWPADNNDAAQAKTMSAYWVNFAKMGSPNGGGLTEWPQFQRQGDQILDFENNGPVVKLPPRGGAIKAIAESYQ